VVTEVFEASKVVIVAGKGGVGKTTVGATLGLAAARDGRDVLLVELEGHSNLGAPFGVGPLGYEPEPLPAPGATGRLRGRRITPDEALADYLAGHGLQRLTRRLIRSGAMDVVTSAAPGIRDLLTLGKIRQLEQVADADLIVVDAPAAGHAVTFLRSAAGMAGAATVGPVREQALEALAMLGDPTRCTVVLVTLAEETPVSELIETAFSLEDDVGVALGPIVVNAVWPELEGLGSEAALATGSCLARSLPEPTAAALRSAASFHAARVAAQHEQIERLASELPLPRLVLPQVFSDRLGPADLERLAGSLAGQLRAAAS
jgi:hypothetical protein